MPPPRPGVRHILVEADGPVERKGVWSFGDFAVDKRHLALSWPAFVQWQKACNARTPTRRKGDRRWS